MTYSLSRWAQSKIATFSAALTLAVLTSTGAVAQDAKPELSSFVIARFGEPPSIPTGAHSDELRKAVDTVFTEELGSADWSDEQTDALDIIGNSKDPRLAWPISDLMRFAGGGLLQEELAQAAGKLLNLELEGVRSWGTTTDHLIAWNIPEPPDYLKYKRAVFTSLVPGFSNLVISTGVMSRGVECSSTTALSIQQTNSATVFPLQITRQLLMLPVETGLMTKILYSVLAVIWAYLTARYVVLHKPTSPMKYRRESRDPFSEHQAY